MLARAADILAAWNRQDPQGIGVSIVEDVMWRDVALGKPLQGREALVAAARKYMSAFPDLRIQETSSTLAGMRLAQELTVVGTHQGTLLGVEPTGRWTETYAAVITTFDEDAHGDRGRAVLEPAGDVPAARHPRRPSADHGVGAPLSSAEPMLRVLLTNDDGIHADGLQALRRALVALEDIVLAVIAPDENMSATARSITTRRPLWVTEVPFDDGTHGVLVRRHAGRLRAAGLARPGRRLRARPRGRRHQPWLQPR